jgi:hypothetical protein
MKSKDLSVLKVSESLHISTSKSGIFIYGNKALSKSATATSIVSTCLQGSRPYLGKRTKYFGTQILVSQVLREVEHSNLLS